MRLPAHRQRIGGRMEFQYKSPTVVILNACPEPALRETRARILSAAGYFPASAGTAEEANSIASSVICSAALICHSFNTAERRLIQSGIEKVLPRTKIVQLSCWENNDPRVLLSWVRDLLGDSKDAKAA